MLRVDAVRVVQDPEYAASLTEAHWHALKGDPVWNELVGEYHEMVAPVLTLYAAQLGLPVIAKAAPAAEPADTEPPAKGGQFQVIGKKIPRIQGLGVVTSLGQYTENMRMPGMLYTRTLRS